MNKLKTIGLSIFLAFNLASLFAQYPLTDGVKGTPSYIAEIKKNLAAEKVFPFDINNIGTTAKIPISVHIVRDFSGNLGVNPYSVNNSVAQANEYFKNINIEFFIDSVNYINDCTFTVVYSDRISDELYDLYAIKNRINLFLVDFIKIDSDTSYGYTYFPIAKEFNYIFLHKGYSSGNYLTTMLGHFMGLLSTHDNQGGSEQVSGNNCEWGGDFICDTYADPNLYRKVNGMCIYTGNKTDGTGSYYVPSIANIMANTQDNCKCQFTLQQYRRMYYYYLKYRQDLGK